METSARIQALGGTGGTKWAVHTRAREFASSGADVLDLTVGEPEIETPPEVIDATIDAIRRGRTRYSDAMGETGLRAALAQIYSGRVGRPIDPEQVLCLPGTQTALFFAMMSVAGPGDQVIVGDPMYATYEGVIASSGAEMVSVPLKAHRDFRLDPADVAAAITPSTRAVLVTTPHNPTGAVLSAADVQGLCEVAIEHDLWIISDEVYADFVIDSEQFHSPLSVAEAADRVIVVSSISKSFAAPGFRSGWLIGPASFLQQVVPLAEAMLFGNQPFIADATQEVLRQGSTVVAGMAERFGRRAQLIADRLHAETELAVRVPVAGMFVMVDVSKTAMSGEQYAHHLIENAGVAVMPGSSFGSTVGDWVRVGLTVDDEQFESACNRIVAHFKALPAAG